MCTVRDGSWKPDEGSSASCGIWQKHGPRPLKSGGGPAGTRRGRRGISPALFSSFGVFCLKGTGIK